MIDLSAKVGNDGADSNAPDRAVVIATYAGISMVRTANSGSLQH